MNEKKKYRLNVAGKLLSVSIRPEDEAYYRGIAKQLNLTYWDIKNRLEENKKQEYGDIGIMAMAAITLIAEGIGSELIEELIDDVLDSIDDTKHTEINVI